MTNINQKNASASSLNTVNSSTIYQSLSVHFEQPVTNVSISPSSQEVVLAGKKGMFILDLEAPYEMPRVLQHITKWEVADVQWNPHVERQNWIASTSNQKVLIWNLAMNPNSTSSSSKHIEMILSSHTRAVSDINWSIFKPEMLATCSLDSYIHLWDLKTSNKKPVNSFCAWTAGATQVKFNKKNEWIIASSHDSDLRIWDIRKGSIPVTTITAHMNKIYGIDWHNLKENEILTCSQDKLVKFWNINDPKVCQGVITTNTPVWRARFTPFGEAVITMPQRNDSQLLMWSCNDLTTPIYSFNGHNDVVREFLWRTKKENLNDTVNYQLITWSKDKTLKLWPVNPKHLKLLGNDNIESDDDDKSNDENLVFITNEMENNTKINNESSLQQTKFQFDTQNQLNTNIDSFTSSISMSFSISETKPPTLPKLNVDSKDMALAVSRNKPMNNLSVMKEEDFDGSYFQEDDDIFTNISNEIEKKEQIRESYIPTTLEDEIEWISKRFPSVRFEKVNFTYRTCTITLHHFESYVKPGIPAVYVKVNIQFPPQYPNKAPPTFQIQKTGMISMANRNFMTNKLEEIASTYAEKSLPCLEASIQFLLSGDASSTLRISTENDEVTYPRNVSFFDDFSFTNNQDDLDNLSSSSSDEISALENKQSFKKKSSNNESRFNYSSTQNVPYPCLCGARFSPTGKLIVFFSPLPHPSVTKFTTHTLGTHNQQPILQTTQFTTQPKTFDLYDSYRNFILVRYPKVFLTGGGVNQDPLHGEDAIITSNPLNQNAISDKLDDGNDGKLNLWFDMDEEDQEETPMPSLFYKPKPNINLQPALASTSNFLRRVRQYTKAKPNIAPGSLITSLLDNKLNSDPMINNESFQLDTNSTMDTSLNDTSNHPAFPSNDILNSEKIIQNDKINDKNSSLNDSDEYIIESDNLSIISQPPSSHETEEKDDSESTTPIVMNKRYHAYQYSGGINLSTSKSSNGLVESITHSTLSSYNESIKTNEEIIREAIDDGMNYNDVQVFAIEDEQKTKEKEKKKDDDSGYFGASIFVKDVQCLLPINKKLAKDYTLHGDDAVVICMKNCRAAKKNNRPDLVKIWGIIGLILSKYRKAIISNNDISGHQVVEEKTSISWKLHPFGRHLVNTIFSYLEKQGDVQTLALLSCVFTIPYKNENTIVPITVSDMDARHMQLKGYVGEQGNQPKSRNSLLLNSQLDYEGSYSPFNTGNMVDGHPATTFTPVGMIKPKKSQNQIPTVHYAIYDNLRTPNNRINPDIPMKFNPQNNSLRPNIVQYVTNMDNNPIPRPVINQNISILNNNYYPMNMPHPGFINQRPLGKYIGNHNEGMRRPMLPEEFNYIQPSPHPYYIPTNINNNSMNNNINNPINNNNSNNNNNNNNNNSNIPIPMQVPLPIPMPQQLHPSHSHKPSVQSIDFNNPSIDDNSSNNIPHPMKNANELKHNSIPKESNLNPKPTILRNPIISTTTNYNSYIYRYNSQPIFKSDNNTKDNENVNVNENSSLGTQDNNNSNHPNSLTNNSNPSQINLMNSYNNANMGQMIVQNHNNNTNEITISRVQPFGEFDDEEGGDVYVPLIDSNKQIIYDRYRIIYAEILYSWGYLEQRAEILKFVTEQHLNVTESPPFELTIKCSHCEKDLIPNNKGFFCMRCNESKRGSICSICRLPVRGLTSFCMICNHGGHMKHIRDWFVKEKNIYCPAGCNCQCVFKNSSLIGKI